MERNKLVWIVLAIIFLLSTGGAVIATNGTDPVITIEPEKENVGRYEIAAWGAHSGARLHASGYYVLDTATGKIVDKGHETYGIPTETLVE